MRVPIGWLRDYVNLPEPEEAIIDKLATLGFPVDSIEVRPPLTHVVAGSITSVEKHPNADRLHVCSIDVRGGAPLTIATAATNVAAGQIVPVALIGSQLATVKIEPRKMRGVLSEGMLCSAEELGLPAEWFEDGILQLDSSVPIGTDVIAHFGLLDPVLDVDVTPNRPDALCMVGIARELAAAYGRPLHLPHTGAGPYAGDSADVRVSIESPDCRRYVAQRFSNLQVRPARARMRVQLALAGQRPINNLVDISNYVMLEVGQPLHFFDFDRIAGRHIVVRDARPGDRLTTLDDVAYALDGDALRTALLICDEGAPQAFAGVKGGALSQVTAKTRELVMESANFNGPRVRRMSLALGLRTEGSTRHEKGLPLSLPDLGAARAAALLALEGASVQAPQAFGHEVPPPARVAVPARDVKRLLGFDIDREARDGYLRSLGCSIIDEDERHFTVEIPPWRTDMNVAVDIVEELARMAGYDRIAPEVPPVFDQQISSATFDRERMMAATLASQGYRETMHLSLEGADSFERAQRAGLQIARRPIEIRNPLSEDQRFMRFSLLFSLLGLVERHKQALPLKFFEIAHVFGDAKPYVETPVVVAIRAGEQVASHPWQDEAFLRLRGDCDRIVQAVTGRTAGVERSESEALHPGKSAALFIDGTEIGFFGAVDPRLLATYDLDGIAVHALTLFLDRLPEYRTPKYRELPRFPGTSRDLALIVDPATRAGDVEAAVARGADGLCERVTVFDEYHGPQVGEGKKSLAVRVWLRKPDATITDAEADTAIERVLRILNDELGAHIRR